MTSRRRFLSGMLAAGLAPQVSWASVGSPAFLSAGRGPQGAFLLAGLSPSGEVLFRHPLPGRGHAATAHPIRPEAVAFARRPGRFADVVDCRNGAALARIQPPAGHHFYGHGTFSPDGSLLFTTENDYDKARGMVGVWDATDGYRRINQFGSGGIGPHDIALRPNAAGLVVANGGIETHPDSGRAKLNLPDMRPNLSYLGFDGGVQEQMELPNDLHLNSIRHLAVRADGLVGFAMQWQGDLGEMVPIVGLHRPGKPAQLMAEDDPRLLNLSGYGGSIAFSADGASVAVTSPRGGVVQLMDCDSRALMHEHQMADVCGIAASTTSFAASTGTGQFLLLSDGDKQPVHRSDLAWDNHLIPLS